MTKTILIVDDSSAMRMIVKHTVSNLGYEILEADDGSTALEHLNGGKIHLICCDLNMPIMGGFDFLEKMRQIPCYRFTPVIMLTTESSEEMQIKGKSIGVKAWLTKPFKPDQLKDAIAKLILS